MFDAYDSRNPHMVKPTRTPHTRQFQQRSTGGFLSHADAETECDTMSEASTSRGDRFESSQRNRNAGDILGHRDNHMYHVSTSKVRVGRKQAEDHAVPAQPSQKERQFGNRCLPEVQNSERFEHSQRNRNAGDILGHRDDAQHPTSAPRATRQRVIPNHESERQKERDEEDCSDDDDTMSRASTRTTQSIKVGRSRVEPPAAIAASEANMPFATDETPVEAMRKPVRHNNHFDHSEGLLTGGSMRRSNVPERKTPLWY